jgi:hypothetical protein
VFSWEGFPSILILDTADYAVQDMILKRLAFFVEKAGFRGRLARDNEIRGLHGWNAHDYRAEDMAAFFDAAERSRFPLLDEEWELERILLSTGIILRTGGGIAAGKGALLSISRESSPVLRSLFMAHEGFHGLFFIDEDFRNFSRRRWDALSPLGKTFLINYFDYQGYDITDPFLVVNEFMAHVLQQGTAQAHRYFGETVARRLESSPRRRGILPPGDERGSWPELGRIFREEAEAFSAYAADRYGLAAGRVHRVEAVE